MRREKENVREKAHTAIHGRQDSDDAIINTLVEDAILYAPENLLKPKPNPELETEKRIVHSQRKPFIIS
jgi:hypothetical protein